MQSRSKIKYHNKHLITLLFSGVLVLIIYFIIYSYISEIQNSKNALLDKLKSIANTSSYMIDGDLHEQLSNSYPSKNQIINNDDDILYYRLHETLESIRRINGLQSQVYTMVFESAKNEFEFIGTSSQYPYYRHSYQKFPETILNNMNTGGTLDTYFSENGKWLSAFAPIKNKKGKVVALIQVDQSFDEFITNARNSLFKNIAISIVIIFPFALLLFAYIKSSLKKEAIHLEILEERNEEIETQNELIQKNNDKLFNAKAVIEKQNEELNSKVEERTSELKNSNEELATFLYRSSHDIQGPLTTLFGLTQLAISDIKDEKSLAYIFMINETTNKLYNTIKSINNLYEIKNKKASPENVELRLLVNNLSQSFSKELNDKKIQLINELPNDLNAYVDKEIFRMVLIELIKNGIHFNSILNDRQPFIKVTGKKNKEIVSISIEDNGLGISSDMRDYIFDMFKKGEENSEGAGLGLYAVKSGIKKLNGSIVLNQTTNEVTRFDIAIPAA